MANRSVRPTAALTPVRQLVTTDADIYGVRDKVRRFSSALGFSRIAQGELVIVASELATNILKYGKKGEFLIRTVVSDRGQPGIELAARDSGPPIRDFEAALRDGWTDGGPIDPMLLLRRKGIGAGLGAVARFSDRLVYEPGEATKTIIAQRFLPRLSRRPPRR